MSGLELQYLNEIMRRLGKIEDRLGVLENLVTRLLDRPVTPITNLNTQVGDKAQGVAVGEQFKQENKD